MTTPLNRFLDLHRRGTRLGLALALAAASLLSPHAVRAQDTTPGATPTPTPTGAAYAAGDNSNGQLGDGTTTTSLMPVAVSNANGFTNSGVTAVAGGSLHSLAVQNGAAYAWGANSSGQLGNNSATSSNVPVAVSNLTTGVTAVAGGTFHSLAVQNGAAFAWGSNGQGQLGNNSATSSNVPVAVSNLTTGVTAVSGGGGHSLAVQNGAAYAWGYNGDGELGNGTTTNSNVPVAVRNLTTGVTAVSGGFYHSLAIQNGAAFAWGYNNQGQLGNNSTTNSTVPVAVSTLTSGVTAVAGGFEHSLALVNGQVYAWGANSSGQLGNGTTTDSNAPVAITVGSANNTVVAIAAGNSSSFALDASGNLYMWGAYSSPFSNTSTMSVATPQLISPPPGFAYTLIGAGSSGGHVVALLSATVPVITSAASSTATVGTAYSYQIAASGNPTSFTATGLPPGLSVDTTTGLISGTVTSAKAVDTYQVTLSATNANGTSAPFTLTLTVALPADPVITSVNTANGTIGVPFSFTITATGTTPLTYSATNLPPGLDVDSASGVISGTPTTAGAYPASIFVSDPYSDSGQGSLTITIVAPPIPVIQTEGVPSGQVGVAYSFQIVASNNPTSYGATNLPGGLSIDTTSGLITGTPTVTGNFTVTLMATNAGGTGTLNVNIFIAPLAPVFTSAASVNALTNQAFVYQLTATNNPDFYDVGGDLPPGLNFDGDSGTIFGKPTTVGTYTVPLFAYNAGGKGTATLTIVVSDAPVPTPIITSALSASAQAGSVFSYQITASNGPTGFDATNLPDGLKVDATSGIVSGTPTAVGTFNFSVSATNPSGTGTANVVLVVTAAPVVPVQPQITSAASASVVAGQPFAYLITASGNPTAYAATGLPAGLTLDPATGLITGTPTATGSFPVGLSATGAGGTGTATLTLTVTAVLVTTPTITSPASASAQVGQVFSYQVSATNNATGYAVTGLPDGLTLNAVSGLITGTPTTAGTFTLALSATNSAGAGTASVSLTVTTAQVLVPVVNSAASASGQVGVAFSYQITASNAALVYGASGLPAGLSLDDTTGILSGVPTAAGTFTVTLMATNSAGTGTASLTLTVAAQPLPVVTVIASVPRVVLGTGQSATFAITRTGGDSSKALTVSYRISGMGINGTDFVMLKGTKTFKPGQLTRRVNVTPEGMLEGVAKKKVKLTVVAGDGYVLGTPITAKVHILTENP